MTGNNPILSSVMKYRSAVQGKIFPRRHMIEGIICRYTVLYPLKPPDIPIPNEFTGLFVHAAGKFSSFLDY